MKRVLEGLAAWLLLSTILGGRPWKPPGGFGAAIEKMRATRGGLSSFSMPKIDE